MFRSFPSSLKLVFLLAIQGICLADTNAQQKTQQYEKSIGEIGRKIKSISQNLNANKSLVATERDKLLKVEQKLHALTESLQTIEYELARNQHELDALELQINSVKKSQANNREALGKLIIGRYYQGKPDYLQKLLNQENPYAVGRLTNYHHYFSSALKNRFKALSQKALELETLKQDQATLIQALTQEQNKQKKLQSDYNKSKSLRAKTIAKLDKKIASNAETLEKLRNDRERLKSLLKQLKEQAAELRRLEERKRQAEQERARQKARTPKTTQPTNTRPVVRPIVKGGFLKQKGRLQFPVKGKITRDFGSRMRESGMRSEGMFFDTQGSVSVKTIFRGRVLFADFLKGYGLLIIVDHGDDHISLYGHNDRLLKKVGDRVESNEVIAKTGVTGGLKSHGLYFEIRDNATPIDASKWCR